MSTAMRTMAPPTALLSGVGSAEEQAGIDRFLATVAAGGRAIVAWDLAHPDEGHELRRLAAEAQRAIDAGTHAGAAWQPYLAYADRCRRELHPAKARAS